MKLLLTAILLLLGSGCHKPDYTLRLDSYNPTWFWVHDKDGKEVVFYRDGILQELTINTNRSSRPQRDPQGCPAAFKDIGGISVYGMVWGATMTQQDFERGRTVQYWMHMSIWNNVEDGTHRNVFPDDVLIATAQEPIVTKNGPCWIITFKP